MRRRIPENAGSKITGRQSGTDRRSLWIGRIRWTDWVGNPRFITQNYLRPTYDELVGAPEVKTLWRKLARLAAHGPAAEFGRALAQRRVAQRGAALGFLYVDGHVRVYRGKYRLPKAHAAQMRLSMPATSDYWVNDTAGDPLFVAGSVAL